MRNSDIRFSSKYLENTNTNCLPSIIVDKTFPNQKCDDKSVSHSFIHCSWNNNGLTSGGGAVHIVFTSSYSSLSLTVDDCSFLHCHETGSVDGGAIYAQRIDAATVKKSFFYDCECGLSTTGPEGGGIILNYIRTLPLIKSCVFVSCMTADDGGGCGIYYSYSTLTYAIDSCRCIKCKGSRITSNQGGGICLSLNYDYLACTNCLLYACEAKSQGGGVWIGHPTGTTVKPITFCFFRGNTAGEGRDVYFYQLPTTPQAIIQSFSYESENVRVSGGSDNWLPQGIIYKGLIIDEEGYHN